MNSLEKVMLALSEYLKERDEEERVRNQEEKIRHEELLEVLGDSKLPFIANFDCCHTHPMLTLPLGCNIELDATERKMSIIEDLFK